LKDRKLSFLIPAFSQESHLASPGLALTEKFELNVLFMVSSPDQRRFTLERLKIIIKALRATRIDDLIQRQGLPWAKIGFFEI